MDLNSCDCASSRKPDMYRLFSVAILLVYSLTSIISYALEVQFRSKNIVAVRGKWTAVIVSFSFIPSPFPIPLPSFYTLPTFSCTSYASVSLPCLSLPLPLCIVGISGVCGSGLYGRGCRGRCIVGSSGVCGSVCAYIFLSLSLSLSLST